MLETVRKFLQKRQDQIIKEITQIAAIPAGPFKEKVKIEFLEKWLQKYDFLKDIKIDAEGNLSAKFPGKINKNVLLLAHSDVALDLPENKIYQEGDLLFGHGVCDDVSGIVAILSLLEFFQEQKIVPEYNLIILFTVGEEGLGAKRGMKYFLKNNANIDLVINAESHDVGRITVGAIGQFRTKISVLCEKGGHSWRDYGNPNAIVLLADLISKLSKISHFEKGESTCNFGYINGGESINAIAKEAHVLYEFRTSSDSKYPKIRSEFQGQIDDFIQNTKNVKVGVEIFNDAPPICLDKNHEIFKFTGKVHQELNIKSFYKDGNTDGDIALQYHIPTVTIGSSYGENTHSREEFLNVTSLENGYAQLFLMVLKLSELSFLKN